jgi:hypothetical protein
MLDFVWLRAGETVIAHDFHIVTLNVSVYIRKRHPEG